MFRRKDCQHQFADNRQCTAAVRNTYHCEPCDATWDDVWSCACDDECPTCRKDYAPVQSDFVARCACHHLKG